MIAVHLHSAMPPSNGQKPGSLQLNFDSLSHVAGTMNLHTNARLFVRCNGSRPHYCVVISWNGFRLESCASFVVIKGSRRKATIKRDEWHDKIVCTFLLREKFLSYVKG